MQTSSLACRNI